MTIPETTAIRMEGASWGAGGESDGGPRASDSVHPQVLAAIRRNLSSQNNLPGPGLNGAARRELDSLAEETDPRIFYSDLIHFAQRQQRVGRISVAATLYELIAGEVSDSEGLLRVPDGIRQTAQRNLAVLRGGGSWGDRLEFQGERFFSNVFSPSMIVGMAVGSTVFTGTRSLLLPRLWGQSAGNFFSAGWGARLAASTVALTAEGLSFWGSSKSMEEFLHPGSQRWDAHTNFREIASLLLTLGLLRGSGFAFGRAHQWAAQASRSAEASQLTQALGGGSPILWQQGGMFTGILLSAGLERKFGWRQSQPVDAFLLDSLATLAQFNAAGALSRGFFPGLHRLNAQQEFRLLSQESRQWQNWTERIPRIPPNGGMGFEMGSWDLGLAWQGHSPMGFRGIPERVRPEIRNSKARDLYVLSSSLEGGEGAEGSSPRRPGTFRQLLHRIPEIEDPQDSVEALGLLYISSVGDLRPLIFESLVAVRESIATPEVVISALLKNPRLRNTDFFSQEIREKVSERFDSLASREISPLGETRRSPTPVDTAALPRINLNSLTVSELLLRLHRMRLEEFSRSLQEGNLSISQRDAARELATLARYFDEAVSKHEKQAETDFLTGLLNKRGLDKITPRLENRLRAYGQFTGGEKKADWVLMIDIDHFKKVNDTYGHPNGDEVLRTVAQILRDSVRYRDISARIGGEEFFILLAKAGQEGARRVAETLRQAVSEKEIVLSGFDPIRVTISVGAAPLRTIPSLMEPGVWTHEGAMVDAKERADRSLYDAKNSGRNRVVISSEGRIPWNKIRRRPTVARFRHLLTEVQIPPEELAAELNWKFSPRLDLSRLASYSGRSIYIADNTDVLKLRHYGRLDYQSLGEILFFARKDLCRNWTVTEASQADRLNIRRDHLTDIERNQRRPNDEELETFATIYGLELEILREARERTRFRRRLKSQF